MTEWNYADVWEAVADHLADAPALTHGARTLRWGELDRRADGLAQWLLDHGVERQDKVALYLANCPEYLEATFAAFKVSLVPINTNYRYADAELAYLWDNSDAEAVVFHGAFTERVERVRGLVARVRLFLHVDDGSGARPDWAMDYEEAAGSLADGEDTRIEGPWGRSGDDLYLLYTGGTTGLPKGVMWRQDDLFSLLNAGSPIPMPDDGGMEGIRQAQAALQESPPAVLPACPLMHGTGAFTALSSLFLGGCVVTLADRRLRAEELLETVGRERVNLVSIVGDTFAKPILAALEAEPGRYDLSSLLGMISSGVMWSEEVKKGLLRHNPNMLLVDAFSSSEALGMGSSVSTGVAAAHTARFTIGERARVIDENGREIVPGSGVAGRLALGGRIPLGYYKDADKTAATFVTIDGERYSVPGDYALVEADGSLQLLGRGSVSINTGGEKVFPEEVEEALKTHPAVADAVVVGIPDDRFGEAITAVVQLAPAAEAAESELVQHVKDQLASYKAPRHVVVVESLGRSPAGKADYRGLRRIAMERLGVTA